MYIKKNDFIILGRTECYFVDWTNKTIGVGTIVAYNNIERIVTIQYKVRHPNEYVTLYRSRDYIWFKLEEALEWYNDYLRDTGMLLLKVMDLTEQLDGSTTTYRLSERIGESYTIYLNGLRQNRENFIVDNDNLTVTIEDLDFIPDERDILSIEYLQKEDGVTV